MQFVAPDWETTEDLLQRSILGLDEAKPEMSARVLLWTRQKQGIIGLGVATGIGLAVDTVDAVIGILGVITAVYIASIVNRLVLYIRASRSMAVYFIDDDEARAVSDEFLPTYTVLVPAYREPEVIAQLMSNLEQLEYPRHKLEVAVILEGDDLETRLALEATSPGKHVRAISVPPCEPRTKPKALNYAVQLCRGEIVTIYDVEDEPEPLQLRKAVVALDRAGPETVCLQAKLSYRNVEQNLITRWFTIEYAMWFRMFLPGLVSLGAPLPLGGTSNHFRRDALDELGGWDPFNVTEDADLGIRLARRGYRCGVLESTTLEESNSDFLNWVKQRSRWYKGYLQTTVVHLRDPFRLLSEIGVGGFVQVILFVLGTPLLAVLNPVFWLMTLLWFSGHPHVIKLVFPAPLFYPALLCWVFGNFLVGYLTVLTCRLMRRTDLLGAAFLVPIYWVMMAVAAVKAVWQLVATPSFWEKTMHGLDRK